MRGRECRRLRWSHAVFVGSFLLPDFQLFDSELTRTNVIIDLVVAVVSRKFHEIRK